MNLQLSLVILHDGGQDNWPPFCPLNSKSTNLIISRYYGCIVRGEKLYLSLPIVVKVFAGAILRRQAFEMLRSSLCSCSLSEQLPK